MFISLSVQLRLNSININLVHLFEIIDHSTQYHSIEVPLLNH